MKHLSSTILILTYFSLAILSCQSETDKSEPISNDIRLINIFNKYNLVGKIKAIYESGSSSGDKFTLGYLTRFDEKGNITEYTVRGKKTSTYVNEYDNKGYLIARDNGKIKINYDDYGNRIEIITGNYTKVQYSYNPKNQLVELSYFDLDGMKLTGSYTYMYDNQGNIQQEIERKLEDDTIRIISKKHFEYDNLNNPVNVLIEYTDARGGAFTPEYTQETIKYEYTFDTQNNWVQRKETHLRGDNVFESKLERKIEYFSTIGNKENSNIKNGPINEKETTQQADSYIGTWISENGEEKLIIKKITSDTYDVKCVEGAGIVTGTVDPTGSATIINGKLVMDDGWGKIVFTNGRLYSAGTYYNKK